MCTVINKRQCQDIHVYSSVQTGVKCDVHVRAGIQIVSITGTARKMEQSIGSFFKIPKNS